MASPGGMPPMTSGKGPYLPTVWQLGGRPSKHVDIPAQSVFLILFLLGAALHMTLFQKNRKRGHKFLPNLFIFIFCMSRVLTSVLRIASISLPTDLSLAIAAQIFVAAGVLILFILNLIFAQRLVRATHPAVGWHPAFSIAYKLLYVLVGTTLVIVITATVQTFYTLNKKTRRIDRDLQLYGSTVLAVIATLPLPITIITLLVPHQPIDKFGTGRHRNKVIILLTGTTLLAFGAWYRSAASWHTPIPRTKPLPGFLGKGPFYIVNFTVEISAVYLYGITRIDQRWHIPNGAKGPGSYSKKQPLDDAETKSSRGNSVAGVKGRQDIGAKANSDEEMDATAHSNRDVEKAELPPPSRVAS